MSNHHTANTYTIQDWSVDVLRQVALGPYSRLDERERAVDELVRRLAEAKQGRDAVASVPG